MIKIALPLANGVFAPHFGGAKRFVLYVINSKERKVTGWTVHETPEHQPDSFPMWLQQQGVTAVIANGMGPTARKALDQQGIEVILGVEGEDPKALVQSYLDGTLKSTG